MAIDGLKPGQSAYILSVKGNGFLRYHLLDMGLGIVSVIRTRKSSSFRCDGNCSGCMFPCRENKEKTAIGILLCVKVY